MRAIGNKRRTAAARMNNRLLAQWIHPSFRPCKYLIGSRFLHKLLSFRIFQDRSGSFRIFQDLSGSLNIHRFFFWIRFSLSVCYFCRFLFCDFLRFSCLSFSLLSFIRRFFVGISGFFCDSFVLLRIPVGMEGEREEGRHKEGGRRGGGPECSNRTPSGILEYVIFGRKKITKKEGKKFLFKKYFLTSTFKTIPCHQKILSIYEEEEEEEEGGGGAFRQLIAASGLPNPTRFQFSRQSASNR